MTLVYNSDARNNITLCVSHMYALLKGKKKLIIFINKILYYNRKWFC